MGNFASSAFQTPSPAATLPSDAVVIDCAWLEATHAHFKDATAFHVMRDNENKTPSSLTSFLINSIPATCKRMVTNPLWVRDAFRCCSQTLRALVTSPAPVEYEDLCTAQATEDKHFIHEFHQVFERNAALKRTVVPAAFVLPSNTVVKTLSKMKSFYGNEAEDSDDEDDFEDCASYTTDATDSLSESECEGKCFAFCSGLECEPQHDDNDNESHDLLYSDEDSDDDDDDGDCVAKAERLLRMASTCSDIAIALDDYLCTCGECPQYKLIAYEVQRYGTYADEAEKSSLTRILQAFSTYNEMIGYDCDMIPTAEECLQVWDGDEAQAFKSFVTLYDEVPHLCA